MKSKNHIKVLNFGLKTPVVLKVTTCTIEFRLQPMRIQCIISLINYLKMPWTGLRRSSYTWWIHFNLTIQIKLDAWLYWPVMFSVVAKSFILLKDYKQNGLIHFAILHVFHNPAWNFSAYHVLYNGKVNKKKKFKKTEETADLTADTRLKGRIHILLNLCMYGDFVLYSHNDT